MSNFGFLGYPSTCAVHQSATTFSSIVSGQPSVNSPFPSVHSDPFSAQTQNSGVTTPFSPFSSRSNANSPFPSVHSNPFSTQTQSSGVTKFSPFSTKSNTNSNPSFTFSPVNPNLVSTQTQSNSVTGFAPFSSQSNANSYISNYSNPFTPQTQSFNSLVTGGFSTNNKSTPFFNSTQSTTIPISKPVISPSSGSRVTPYASTKEPEGNFHSISSMPVYKSKSHEELRFEDYWLCKKDGQSATTQAENGIQLNSFCPCVFPPLKPTCTNLFPAIVSPPINSHTTFPGFISPANTQSMPSNPTFLQKSFVSSTVPSVSTSVTTGLFTPSTSATATTQENIFALKCSSSAFDLPNSPNIAPPLSSFVPNSSLSPQNQSSVGPDAVQVSSNSHPGLVISVQYGISSLSVSDKAAPTRRRSLLIVRHSSLNRAKMLPPRYNLDSNASRVPFFMAGEEKAKTNSVIFPRENPRSWIRPPTKECPQSYNSNTLPEMEHTSINVYENGNVTQVHLAKGKQTDTCEAVNYKHDIDVDDIMPKLKNEDYYTEPTIQELAAKEREESGFCGGVRDFVVGRRGFGAIKFTGETDVRGLELDALIQFNYHEVIVYMDDSKKPEVGKGLNKPAELTLLNLKCINKKTGEEYKDGALVDKYKNLLIRKSAEQGAEFVSYDPVKGEWKFKVKHF